jgi:hypothetical protein
MCYKRTPPLSDEGIREVLEELANPPKNTPERRAMCEHAQFMRELRDRQGAAIGPVFTDEQWARFFAREPPYDVCDDWEEDLTDAEADDPPDAAERTQST